jgi:hypothetical protein
MSKKNEDSVERFFRKAVEQHDDTFMQRDWQKMEQMLDAEAAKVTVAKFQRLKKAIFRGTVVTGIIALVYFLVIDLQHPESRLLTDALVKKQAVAGAEAPTTKPGTENPSTATLFPETDAQRKSQHTDVPPALNFATKKVPTIGGSNEEIEITRSFFQKDDNSNLEAIATEATSGQVTPRQSHITDQDKDKDQITSTAIELTNQAGDDVNEDEVAVADNKEITKEHITDAVPAENTSNDTKEKKIEYFPRWNVAVKLAPDFSTTVLNRYTAPGSAFGITIGYNITSRIAINTGVIRSFKKYEGYGSEYSPPPGYWKYKTNGIVPDEVSGNCNILEFPLSLQLQLNRSQRHRVFATAGITSYYMLDETYHYKFNQPNPGADDSWSTDEPTSYAFSVGVLTASYERQITPNFAIGIEPFLKVPFAGIGWTNIELFTTGAYFNLRYRFINKNRTSESVKSN